LPSLFGGDPAYAAHFEGCEASAAAAALAAAIALICGLHPDLRDGGGGFGRWKTR
jgi:hypothetical protein